MRPFLSPRRPRVGATASGSTTLIGASDITYLGKYYLSDHNGGFIHGFGLRRVAGQVRFMTMQHYPNSNIVEWAKPSSYDSTITSSDRTNNWDTASVISQQQGSRSSLTWDWAQNRLCISQAVDYDAYVGNLQFCTLSEGGSTVTSPKKLTLENVNDRQGMSGIMNVPSAFQSAYSFEPYILAGGGYSSRQGSATTSMGFSCWAFPNYVPYLASSPSNPDINTVGATILSSTYRLCSYHDHQNRGVVGWYNYTATADGTTNDDYPLYPSHNSGMGSTGITNYNFTASHSSGAIGPITYYDGGDPRDNPGSGVNPVAAPKFIPFTTGGPTGGSPYYNFAQPFNVDKMHWSSGTAYPWVWGDMYCGGAFLYGSKRGILHVNNAMLGKNYYHGSAGHFEQRMNELHIIDPIDIKDAANGSLDPTTIQPTYIIPLVETLTTNGIEDQYQPTTGAAYDYTSNILYVCVGQGETGPGAVRDFIIYAYSVAA